MLHPLPLKKSLASIIQPKKTKAIKMLFSVTERAKLSTYANPSRRKKTSVTMIEMIEVIKPNL